MTGTMNTRVALALVHILLAVQTDYSRYANAFISVEKNGSKSYIQWIVRGSSIKKDSYPLAFSYENGSENIEGSVYRSGSVYNV